MSLCSAALGEEWKSLTLEQQQPFHRKANQLRAEFDARNPGEVRESVERTRELKLT